MDEQNKEQAKTHGRRAASQAKNAAKNTGRALRDVAEPVAEDVREGVEDTIDRGVETAKKVDPVAVARGLSKTGQGFIGLSVAVTAATFAANRFLKARQERFVVDSVADKALHHIRADEAA